MEGEPRRRQPAQRRLIRVAALLRRWAESGRVRRATATWGFAQSAILPGPDWALLIPLGLADPKRVFLFARWTAVGSFFGVFVAYAIGAFAFDRFAMPLLQMAGIGADTVQDVRDMFARHGWLVALVGSFGFVPIPAKVVSMAAGGFGIPLLPFALAVLVGRSARFFVLAAIIRFAGLRLVGWIERRAGRALATLR